MSIPALVSALAPVREKFVQQYDAWIVQMRKDYPSGAPELAVKLGPHTGLVRQLYRVDYASAWEHRRSFGRCSWSAISPLRPGPGRSGP